MMKKQEEEARREAERADLKVLNKQTDVGESLSTDVINTTTVVPAPKRAYVPKKLVVQPIPKNLKVLPEDSPEVAQKKKRKIHMIKGYVSDFKNIDSFSTSL